MPIHEAEKLNAQSIRRLIACRIERNSLGGVLRYLRRKGKCSVNRILATAGLLGGLLWIALAFVAPIDARETREYEVMWNRCWTPALLGLLAGFGGQFLRVSPLLTRTAKNGFITLLVGLALMLIGNFAEYWVLSDLPHEGPDGFIRGLAWMTVLLGLLVMQVASAIVGYFGLKSSHFPKWQNVMFLLLLPITIAIGFISLNWAGTPMGIAGTAVGLSGLLRDSSRTSPVSSV